MENLSPNKEKPPESKYSYLPFNLKEKRSLLSWTIEIVGAFIMMIIASHFITDNTVWESIGNGLWLLFFFMFIANPIHNWWIDRKERKLKENDTIAD